MPFQKIKDESEKKRNHKTRKRKCKQKAKKYESKAKSTVLSPTNSLTIQCVEQFSSGQIDAAADSVPLPKSGPMQNDWHFLIGRRFKQFPSLQAMATNCAAVFQITVGKAAAYKITPKPLVQIHWLFRESNGNGPNNKKKKSN